MTECVLGFSSILLLREKMLSIKSTTYFLLIALSACANSIFANEAASNQQIAPLSTTHFRSKKVLSTDDQIDESIRMSPSVQLNDQGGELKSKTLSIRGSESSETGLELEGIRLNSVARGTANLGELDLFGLEEMEILRGGHPFLQSSPGGQILLRLPRNASVKSRIELGSYESMMIGQLSPRGSLSFRRTEGNFPYHYQGQTRLRDNNESILTTARLWKFGKDWQIWAQGSFSDQSSPGPVSAPTPDDYLQSLQSTIGAQRVYRNVEFSVWSQLGRQEYFAYGAESQSVSTYHGFRMEKSHSFRDRALLKHRIEASHDYLRANSLTNSQRWTLIYGANLTSRIRAGHFLNPRFRFEYVSDLNRGWSVHPGFGGQHRILSPVDFVWNVSMMSRTPTFYELHFEDPYFRSNKNLSRQKSYLVDGGVKWSSSFLQYQPSVFFTYTENLIETVVESATLSSVANRGRAKTWGLENEFHLFWHEKFESQIQYTYQQSKRGESDRVYQPRHRLQWNHEWRPSPQLKFSFPLYYRSRVKTPSFYADPSIGAQWDLGLKAELQRKSWSFDLQLMNALGWKREEIKEYPLAQEPQLKLGIEYKWGKNAL